MNYKILEILKKIDLNFNYFGKNIEIFGVKPISEIKDNFVGYIKEENYFELYKNKIASNSIIISNINEVKDYSNLILTENPKLFFVKICSLLKNRIDIDDNNIIGSNFKVGENCVIKNCIIGNNVSIQSNCVVGEDGYGYIKDLNGEYINFPHIGKVIIEDNVEIHSNTCINRGSLNNTIIRKGCKIHDLVHIGHGVEIGENTLVITQSMIAGSVKIGKNCWISPGSQIIDRISIADNTTIGLGSVILKDIINPGETWAGNPARKIR